MGYGSLIAASSAAVALGGIFGRRGCGVGRGVGRRSCFTVLK